MEYVANCNTRKGGTVSVTIVASSAAQARARLGRLGYAGVNSITPDAVAKPAPVCRYCDATGPHFCGDKL